MFFIYIHYSFMTVDKIYIIGNCRYRSQVTRLWSRCRSREYFCFVSSATPVSRFCYFRFDCGVEPRGSGGGTGGDGAGWCVRPRVREYRRGGVERRAEHRLSRHDQSLGGRWRQGHPQVHQRRWLPQPLQTGTLKVHSHLRFIRHELLRELFRPCNCEKWVQNPLLNFLVQVKIDQISSVNVSPLFNVCHFSFVLFRFLSPWICPKVG